MNDPKSQPDQQLDTLFALARANRPNTSSLEYAFETRLLARLHSQKETGSIWAIVSWRMMPFFAACFMALTVWRQEIITETDDAAQTAYIENSATLDSGAPLDL